MKHFIAFLLFLCACHFSEAQLRKKPKLVVGIVVDQMRYDYLSKYWDGFSEGGFKKLVDEGYVMANTHYHYAPTFTGVGHATIATGTSPAIHGIAGNNWYSRELKKGVYCVDDSLAKTVGSKSSAGEFSPKNLKVSTVADQLKLASKNSKVLGIALKDRGAILLSGHLADAAYWFDPTTGNFVTSNYYMEQLPKWVTAFNKKRHVKGYLSTPWNTLHPIDMYQASTDDDMPFEALFKGKEKAMFPYDLPSLSQKNGLGIIRQTPFGNSFTLDFAKEAILQEQLGADGHTDFLALSFSSPDYIGHMFGPHSIEVEDNYLRLDKDLADFLVFLEQNIGKDDFLIFLTSDHGAADVPAYAKGNTGYFENLAHSTALQKTVLDEFGHNLIEIIINDQVYLDQELIKENNVDEKRLRERIRIELLKQEGVVGVFDQKMAACQTDEKICQKINHGLHPGRSGDITFIKAPGWLDDYTKKGGGTTHGSPFPYDTHVPLIWYGMGVRSGRLFREVHVRDIAPTLSLLLGISMPNGAIGIPVAEYLDEVFRE